MPSSGLTKKKKAFPVKHPAIFYFLVIHPLEASPCEKIHIHHVRWVWWSWDAGSAGQTNWKNQKGPVLKTICSYHDASDATENLGKRNLWWITIGLRLIPPTVHKNSKWLFQVKLLNPGDAERIQAGQSAFVKMIHNFFSGIQLPSLHTIVPGDDFDWRSFPCRTQETAGSPPETDEPRRCHICFIKPLKKIGACLSKISSNIVFGGVFYGASTFEPGHFQRTCLF